MFTNNVYVTVNGFPLHGTDSNGSEWIVNKTDGFLDGASSTLATTQKIWAHGVFTNQPFYTGRVVSLEGFVRGTTAENAILSWDSLKQALSLDTQDVVIDWRGYKRLLRGKQSGQPLVEWFDRYTLKFSLEFTSNTPFLYSAGGVLSGSTYLPHTNGGMTFPYVFEGDGTVNLYTRWTGTPDASTSTLSQDGQVVATNLYTNPSFEGAVDDNVLVIKGSSSIVGPGVITPYHGTKRISFGQGNDNRVSVNIPDSLLGSPVHMRMMVLGWAGVETVSAAPNDGKSFSPVTRTMSAATATKWVPFDIDFTPQTENFWIIFSSTTGSIGMDAFGVYAQSDWQAMQALGVDWFDGDTYPGSWVNDWGFPEESTSGSITLNSHGTASSPVIITISGYVVNPRVEHRQTGAALALNYTIPVGETVVLNGETREVLINGKIPSQQIVSSRQWFTAGPGENTFMFSADDGNQNTATISVEMREAWL